MFVTRYVPHNTCVCRVPRTDSLVLPQAYSTLNVIRCFYPSSIDVWPSLSLLLESLVSMFQGFFPPSYCIVFWVVGVYIRVYIIKIPNDEKSPYPRKWRIRRLKFGHVLAKKCVCKCVLLRGYLKILYFLGTKGSESDKSFEVRRVDWVTSSGDILILEVPFPVPYS